MKNLIIINGVIGSTYFGENKGLCIFPIMRQKAFDGTFYTNRLSSIPLAKLANDSFCYQTVNLKYIISDNIINKPNKELNTYNEVSGHVTADFYEDDKNENLLAKQNFKIGDHDILKILSKNFNKYIHMEIEIT